MDRSGLSEVGNLPRNRTFKAFLTVVPALITCLLLVSIPQTTAHSPLTSGENESLTTAAIIPDPAKSWAIYAELHEAGEAQYYQFNVTQGERIYAMLLKSTRPENEEFVPTMILMGPGLPSQGVFPDYVEVPDEAGVLVAQSEQPKQATYEPFSPSSFYALARIDLDAPATGTYYVAVHDPAEGGYYGLAIGYIESYSLSEWLLIPVSLISVYQWDGQSIATIFAPAVATLAVGFGFIWWRKFREARWSVFDIAAVLAGLLFIGTGVSILFQMILALAKTSVVPEIALTLILAVIPMILGTATLRLVIKRLGTVTFRLRVYLVILAFAALLAWAGLLIGSALALVASVFPRRASVRLERK